MVSPALDKNYELRIDSIVAKFLPFQKLFEMFDIEFPEGGQQHRHNLLSDKHILQHELLHRLELVELTLMKDNKIINLFKVFTNLFLLIN